jgi:O-phosphoseryl-tRNA(Cys) synthetase
MKNPFKFPALVVAAVSLCLNVHAGLLDELKSVASSTNGAVASVSALPEDQVVNGLKEALGNGVTHAVASLGHSGGFLTNLNVKIPMPGKLATVEKGLRMAGENQMADEFVASMNHAAEQAVPVAADVFGDAIKQISITDAKNILSGPDDAATQYFRKTTQTNLFAKFYPIVQKSTDSVGVTQKYKAMMGKFASVNSLSSMFGSSSPVKLNEADIDTYVTNKALDGLFKMVAAEEKDIRANPAARTTDLLKSVFGAATK